MSSKRRPNIIVFLMDCARFDHMSCYGYSSQTTANIDRIAKEGVLYKNALTTSGWTLPAHASLFTGVYPSLHGASRQHLYLDDKYPTIASILDKEGYETAGFSSISYVSRETYLDRGFNKFYESFSKDGIRNRFNRYAIRYKATKLMAKSFRSWAKEAIPGKIVNWKVKHWFKERNLSKPFFLFIHYIDVHKPYRFNSYYNRLFIKDKEKLNLSKEISDYNWPHFTLDFDRTDKEMILSLYDAKLFSVDCCISDVIRHLRAQGLYDNTVLFLLSDHGEIITGKFDHHFFLTDEVLRIPLIVKWPELFKPGTEREDLVSIIDILPSILDVLDLRKSEYNSHLQGYSLLKPYEKERYVIAERGKISDPWFNKFPELKELKSRPLLDYERRIIRTKEYKFIWSSDGKYELYNILSDPMGKKNILSSRPDLANRLKDQLFDILKAGKIKKDHRRRSDFGGKLKRSLENLGYL